MINHVGLTSLSVSTDPDSLWEPHQWEHVQQDVTLSAAALHTRGTKYKQMHKQLQNKSIITILTEKTERPQFHTRFYAHSMCILHFFVIVNALNGSWKHPLHFYILLGCHSLITLSRPAHWLLTGEPPFIIAFKRKDGNKNNMWDTSGWTHS